MKISPTWLIRNLVLLKRPLNIIFAISVQLFYQLATGKVKKGFQGAKLKICQEILNLNNNLLG